jgi:hypothetical protein
MRSIDAFARILFTARCRSRRLAKRELREAGGLGTATELEAVLGEIERSPNRAQIEHLADELGAAHARAMLAPRPADVPLLQGRGHDEWIIGEGAESRRMYVIYVGPDAAFIGEVFDDVDDAPLDLEVYDLDEEQVLGNVVWLDDPPELKERFDLFEVAREKLRAYDSMQERDMEELEDE